MDTQKMESLGRVVGDVDAESPEAQEQAAQEQQQQATQEAEAVAWAVIPTTVGKLVCMFAPELAPVYSPESCLEWGQNMAAVAQKHGWSGPGMLPEVGLIISSAGFVVPSYLVIKAKLQALEKARKDAAPVDVQAREVRPSPATADAVSGHPQGGQ